MEEIRFVHLSEVNQQQIIDLMNNEMVGKQLPLLANGFSTANCRAFLNAKKQLWDQHGYGPWAFLIKDEFAGWGGLQTENGDADFALVLHPRFWGWGRRIFNHYPVTPKPTQLQSDNPLWFYRRGSTNYRRRNLC